MENNSWFVFNSYKRGKSYNLSNEYVDSTSTGEHMNLSLNTLLVTVGTISVYSKLVIKLVRRHCQLSVKATK